MRSRRSLRLRRRDGGTAVLASPPPGQLSLDEFKLTGIWNGGTLSPVEGMEEGASVPTRRWRFG